MKGENPVHVRMCSTDGQVSVTADGGNNLTAVCMAEQGMDLKVRLPCYNGQNNGLGYLQEKKGIDDLLKHTGTKKKRSMLLRRVMMIFVILSVVPTILVIIVANEIYSRSLYRQSGQLIQQNARPARSPSYREAEQL